MRQNERQGGGRTYESGAANEREFGTTGNELMPVARHAVKKDVFAPFAPFLDTFCSPPSELGSGGHPWPMPPVQILSRSMP